MCLRPQNHSNRHIYHFYGIANVLYIPQQIWMLLWPETGDGMPKRQGGCSSEVQHTACTSARLASSACLLDQRIASCSGVAPMDTNPSFSVLQHPKHPMEQDEVMGPPLGGTLAGQNICQDHRQGCQSSRPPAMKASPLLPLTVLCPYLSVFSAWWRSLLQTTIRSGEPSEGTLPLVPVSAGVRRPA